MSIAFNPSGDLVATAGADDTVDLCHAATGRLFSQPILAEQGQVMSVAFNPRGNSLATGGDDGTVKLWDLSGKEVGKFVGHQSKVLDVRFSPDGEFIATASADGTVRLWLASGDQVNQYTARRGFLAEEALGGSFGAAGLSLSPDGRKIAIAQSDDTVLVSRVQSLGELLDAACGWLGPYLATHPDAPRVCQ